MHLDLFGPRRSIDAADVPALMQRALELLCPDAGYVNTRTAWAIQPNGTRVHAFTHITIDDSPIPAKDIDAYSHAIAHLRSVPLPGAAASLHDLPRGDLLTTKKGFEVEGLTGGIAMTYWTRQSSRDGRAHLEFAFSIPKAQEFAGTFSRLLTTPSGPMFEGGIDFVRHWCDYPDWQPTMPYNTSVVVHIPDQRAEITDVYLSELLTGELTVRTTSKRNLVSAVAFVAKVVSDSHANTRPVLRGHLSRSDSRNDEWTLHVSPEWDHLTLAALDSAGTELDRILNINLRYLHQHQAPGLSETEVARLVSTGESGDTDFKSWASLTGQSSGRNSFLKDVCAFANTRGGRILIGVNKQGEPDGPATQFLANAALVLSPDANAGIATVREWLQEHVRPSLKCQLQPAVLDGRVILVVSVPAGTEKPYTGQPGLYHYRDAAHSLPATREHLLQMLSNK